MECTVIISDVSLCRSSCDWLTYVGWCPESSRSWSHTWPSALRRIQ